jgi:hypothetical protein
MASTGRQHVRRRLFVAAAVAVAGMVVTAGPAVAKVLDLYRLTITGADLDETLVVKQREFGVPRTASDPRMVATAGLLGAQPKTSARPEGQLGARFELSYEFRSFLNDKPRFFRVQESLYPYATAGPVAFTPAGQKYRFGKDSPEQEVPSGWRSYPPRVVEILQAHGLPVLETTRLNLETVQPQRPWLLVSALVVLLAFAARFYRRGSSTAPA